MSLVEYFPTGDKVEKRTKLDLSVANLIVGENLSLSLVESSLFRDVLVAASGVMVSPINTYMSRTTLLENMIKGGNGKGPSLLELSIARAESYLETWTLLTASIDSSRNISRVDINVLNVSGPRASFPYGAFSLGTDSHSGSNIAASIAELLTPRPDEAGINDLTALRAFQLGMSQKIAVLSSDHARNIQNALGRIEEDMGILLAGDGAHAMARLMEHVFAPFYEAVPNVLELNKFLRAHKFFYEYFMEEAKILLVQESGTRFANILLILARILRLKKVIRDRFNMSDFDDWLEDCEDPALAEKMKEYVNHPKFFNYVELLIALGTPILRALRFFDAELPGNVCYVYLIWRAMLGNLTKHVATSIRRDLMPSVLWNQIVDAFHVSWGRFNRPIYSAAYFLSPVNQPIFSSDNTPAIKKEMKEVLEHTVHCICTMFRRFDPETGKARPKIFELGGTEVVAFETKVRQELGDYRLRDGIYANLKYTEAVEPSKWWDNVSESSIIAWFCRRLTTFTIGSTGVERLHYLRKRVKTGVRNRLLDANLEVLVFCNRAAKAVPRNRDADLKRIADFMRDWENMSEEDESFCNLFEARMNVPDEEDSPETKEANSETDDEDEGEEGDEEVSTKHFAGVGVLRA